MKTFVKFFSHVFAALLGMYGLLLVYTRWTKYHANLNALPNQNFSWTAFIADEGVGLCIELILFVGALLFFFRKKIGWIITAGLIIPVALFIAAIVIKIAPGKSNTNYVLAGLVVILSALSIFSLWAKTTRERFNIGRNEIIASLVFILVFAAGFKFLYK